MSIGDAGFPGFVASTMAGQDPPYAALVARVLTRLTRVSQADLAQPPPDLACAQADFARSRAKLACAQADLVQARADLACAQADLVRPRPDLACAQADLV